MGITFQLDMLIILETDKVSRNVMLFIHVFPNLSYLKGQAFVFFISTIIQSTLFKMDPH